MRNATEHAKVSIASESEDYANTARLRRMAAISMGVCVLPLALALAPPVLRFTDCKTGREIVLVGCMHGNPTSIQLTEAVLRECAG